MTIRRGLRLAALSRGVGRHFLQAQTGEQRTTGEPQAASSQAARRCSASAIYHVLIRSLKLDHAGSQRTRLTEARLPAALVCTTPFKRPVKS
jgi:hypothetical protein